MIMYTKQVNNSKSKGRVDIDTRVDIDAHPMNIGGGTTLVTSIIISIMYNIHWL